MRQGHIAAGFYTHLAVDTHVLVGRARIPVGKTDVGFAGLCTKHLNLQLVLFGNLVGYIKLKLSERAVHLLAVGYLLAVKPYVGAVADTIEVQHRMFALVEWLQLKSGAVLPAFIKLCFVNPGIVVGSKCLGFYAVGSERTHQGARHLGWYPTIGCFYLPVHIQCLMLGTCSSHYCQHPRRQNSFKFHIF